MKQTKAKRDDLKVFISSRESKCDECKEDLDKKAWITLTEEKGALCLSCADLDHLVFLPSGDALMGKGLLFQLGVLVMCYSLRLIYNNKAAFNRRRGRFRGPAPPPAITTYSTITYIKLPNRNQAVAV